MGEIGELLALLEDGRVGPALAGTALASARLYAMIRILPFLGGRRVPATLHLGLAAALGLVMGVSLETIPSAPLLAALAVKEVAVGFAVGFLASLPFRFIEQSGVLADHTRTTTLTTTAVAAGSGGSSPTGNLFLLMATGLFFLTPAHRAFWTGIQATFEAVPVVGGMPRAGSIATAAVASSAGLLAASVMLALPVLLAVLLTDLSIGAAGRFVPHSGGTFTFMPLRSVVGLGALLVCLTVVAPVMARLLLESMRWLAVLH
jgi:flagellar biosynthetic protein FliR